MTGGPAISPVEPGSVASATPGAAGPAGGAAVPTSTPRPAVTVTARPTESASPTAAASRPAATTRPSPEARPTASAPAGPSSQTQSSTTVGSWTDRVAESGAGQVTGLASLAPQGVRLAGQSEAGSTSGEFLSGVRETGFGFDNAVLSWNADVPAGTALRLELRVRDTSGWSGWYAMGEWGQDGGRSVAGQADARGRVDVDTLKLASPASALQYRAKLSSTSAAASPLLRQVSVTYASMRSGLGGPAMGRVPGAVRDINVPQRSQLEEDPSYRSEICSPTSLAMLMQYWGLDRPVAQVVAGVRDGTARIYGNWALNMAYAGANGFDARVERYYSMVQLEEQIAAGRPVAISIAFNPGELSASPIKSTDGHLIVVRGFTSDGNVIVNDPIASSAKAARLVYDRDELSRIWLRSGGITYVVSPRAGGPLAR